MQIRTGTSADAGAVLAMLDGAVRWLVARGLTGQWGGEPFSSSPSNVERIQAWAAGGGMRVAEDEGVPVGAMVLGDAPAYVPVATEPEVYLLLLVTDRDATGRGVGRVLVDRARAETAERGAGLLRVDCWAGGRGALVRYYESVGFTASERFTYGNWQGQVLEQRVA